MFHGAAIYRTRQRSELGLLAAVFEPLLYSMLAFYMRVLQCIFIFGYLNIVPYGIFCYLNTV